MRKVSSWTDLSNVKNKYLEIEIDRVEKNKLNPWSIVKLSVIDKFYDVHFNTNFYENNLKTAVEILDNFGFDIEYEEPFNLVEFLKESIEPIIFSFDKYAYCFEIKNDEIVFADTRIKTIGTKYFKFKNNIFIIEDIFKEKKVTPMQLIGALEELGWI